MLCAEPNPLPLRNAVISNDGASQPRLLMLTHRLPYPPNRGDRIRSYHLLRELSPHYRITLATISDRTPADHSLAALGELTDHLLVRPVSRWRTRRRAAQALLRGQAATPAAFYHRGLARALIQAHRAEPFDAVLTFCTGMIGYARRVMAASGNHVPRHVVDLVDVDSLKWSAYGSTASWPMRWVYAAEGKRLKRIEACPATVTDAITVISDAEAQAYRKHVADHPGLTVVPNGVDTDSYTPLPDPANHTLVFTGVLDYKPNVDAVRWFASEVMPLLRVKLPRAKLLVVGRHPGESLRRLHGKDGLYLVGEVEDIRTWIGRASLVVAPLQLARGVQNKVLQAMACQRAVLCSPAAAEGIDARAGLHLAVAHDAQRFVTIAHRLLTHPTGRQRMAQMARKQVCKVYGWSQVLQPMRELLQPAAGVMPAKASRPIEPTMVNAA